MKENIITGLVRSHSVYKPPTSPNKMEVTPILALKDNYMYVLVDKKTRECAVVDPVEPKKVIQNFFFCV